MTIKEISNITGLSIFTLRYYEKEGLIIRIKRDKNGRRDYNKEDVDWINFIKCLKITGMPINKIKIFINLFIEGDKTINERKKILLIHKEKILKKIDEYNNYLEKINIKIDHYNKKQKFL